MFFKNLNYILKECPLFTHFAIGNFRCYNKTQFYRAKGTNERQKTTTKSALSICLNVHTTQEVKRYIFDTNLDALFSLEKLSDCRSTSLRCTETETETAESA